MIWLIKRFLKAGVVESGVYQDSAVGTPQGGIISPLLANIYLHYVLDLWFSKEILAKARDKMRLIRYCDDFVACCGNKKDAEEFLERLKLRLKKFNLEVAEDKTKIIKFGRKEWKARKSQQEKADSFTFLGFTHYLGTTRKGRFSVKHKTAKQSLQRKLCSIKVWLKKTCNVQPLKEWWNVLKAKLLGHYRYYGVSGNYRSIYQFYRQVVNMAFKWINRRSQKKSIDWQQYLQYLDWNPLPKPKIYYQMYETPLLCSNATLKSPVWENHQQGSVRASIATKQQLVNLVKE